MSRELVTWTEKAAKSDLTAEQQEDILDGIMKWPEIHVCEFRDRDGNTIARGEGENKGDAFNQARHLLNEREEEEIETERNGRKEQKKAEKKKNFWDTVAAASAFFVGACIAGALSGGRKTTD